MRFVISAAWVGLLDQNALRRAVPDARPGRVRPAQAERKIRRPGGKHLIKGTFENSPAREPIMVITESLDTVTTRQSRLSFAGFRHA